MSLRLIGLFFPSSHKVNQLNKEMKRCVDFANFVLHNDLETADDLGELMTLIKQRRDLYVKANNESLNLDKELAAVESLVEKKVKLIGQTNGWTFDGWHSLRPSIKDKDGYDVRLPY